MLGGAEFGEFVRRSFGVMLAGDGFEELLGTFVREVAAAQEQDRCHGPRRELTEHQCDGQDEQQLVAQRAEADLPDDGQFPVRQEAMDVLRRHGGVVHDDAHGLDTGLARSRRHVIEGGCRRFGDGRNVVQQGR